LQIFPIMQFKHIGWHTGVGAHVLLVGFSTFPAGQLLRQVLSSGLNHLGLAPHVRHCVDLSPEQVAHEE
jgi:hypothetical protein